MLEIVYSFKSPDKCLRKVESFEVDSGGTPAAAEHLVVQLKLGKELQKHSYETVYQATVVPSESGSRSPEEGDVIIRLGTIQDIPHFLVRKRDISFFKFIYPEVAARSQPALKVFPGGTYAAILPRLPGYTLETWLNAGNITRFEKLQILSQVVTALKRQLHARGVYHGSLSLKHIFVTKGEPRSVFFANFGFAYFAGGEVSHDYIAPEERHYFHPDRRDPSKAKLLKPHPSQDICSLLYCLQNHVGGFDAEFLDEFYHGEKVNSVTVNEVLNAIEKEIAVEGISFLLKENKEFAGEVKAGFDKGSSWLRQHKAEWASSRSEENIVNFIKLAGKRLLFAWSKVKEPGGSKIEGELRPALPDYLSWVSDESLAEIVRYDQRKQLILGVYQSDYELFNQEFYFGGDDNFCAWLEKQNPGLRGVKIVDLQGCSFPSRDNYDLTSLRERVISFFLEAHIFCSFIDRQEVQLLVARGELVSGEEGVRLLRERVLPLYNVENIA